MCMKNSFYFFLLLLTACSSLQYNAQKELSSKKYSHVAPQKLWEALKVVVQSEGYGVETEDFPKGILVAAIQRTPGLSSMSVNVRTLGHLKEELYKLIINLKRVDDKTFESRVSFQVVSRHSLGGFKGEEIVNPIIYQDFYRKLDAEVGTPSSVPSTEVKTE